MAVQMQKRKASALILLCLLTLYALMRFNIENNDPTTLLLSSPLDPEYPDKSVNGNDVLDLEYNLGQSAIVLVEDVAHRSDKVLLDEPDTADKGVQAVINDPVNQSIQDVSEPMEGVSATTEDVSARTEDVSEPTEGVSEPTEDHSEPVEDVSEPAEIQDVQAVESDPSNHRMIYNDVLTEDVMPDYYNNTADLVPQYEAHLQDTERNMEARLARIRDVCQTNQFTAGRSNLYHFPKHHLTWCPVFKAGSTNWKMVFCRQYRPDVYKLHIDNPEVRNKYCELPYFKANEKARWSASKWTETIAKSVNFLTARHPYERLVSAYRNKFLDCRDWRFIPHTMTIMKGFRKVDPSLGEGEKKTLLEAARKLCSTQNSDIIRERSDRTGIDPNNPYMHPLGATFKEFITYIIHDFKHKAWLDFHWGPIYKSCDICKMNYDVIEKFETLERDHHYLLHKIGRLELLPMIAGSHHNPTSNTGTDTNIIQYLETLDEQLILDLYLMFKTDFDLFGYKPHIGPLNI